VGTMHEMRCRYFNPFDPPILGEVVGELGDTPKPLPGGVLDLFIIAKPRGEAKASPAGAM